WRGGRRRSIWDFSTAARCVTSRRRREPIVRIAYVIPAYPPAPSQPFVVNEMVEVQEAGHDVYVLPLYSDRTTLSHGTFARFRPAAVFTPALFDLRMLGIALRVLVTHPVRVVRTLVSAHRAAGGKFWAHAKLLAVTPKALAAVRWLRAA